MNHKKLRRLYREERLQVRRRGGRKRALGTRAPIALPHARAVLTAWKDDYNTIRPHSRLGNLPPAAYAKLSDPAMQRDGTLRSFGGSAPHPVAPPSPMGSNEQQTLLING